MTWKELADFATAQCLQFGGEPVYGTLAAEPDQPPIPFRLTGGAFDDRGPSLTAKQPGA